MNVGRIAVALIALATSACSGADETGQARFTTWGEEYIEAGIPAADFADGWAATFDRFLVVIGDVTVADGENGHGADLPGTALYDLTTPGPHEVGLTGDLAAGGWDQVSFAMPKAASGTELHQSATAADLTLLSGAGYAVYVEGTASKAGQSDKTFRWGFSTGIRYESCIDLRAGQQIDGIVIGDGETTDVQLTMHGDHLFYDDLSGDAALRFQHMADADADADGEVTLAELETVQLANLPPGEGPYGVGAANVNNLGDFVRAAVRTLGHFNGEGHCYGRLLE